MFWSYSDCKTAFPVNVPSTGQPTLNSRVPSFVIGPIIFSSDCPSVVFHLAIKLKSLFGSVDQSNSALFSPLVFNSIIVSVCPAL